MTDIERTKYLRDLRREIIALFSLAELETLAFDLSIDWDTLAGDEKLAKVQSLIMNQARRGKLKDLLILLKEERPGGEWPGIPPVEQQIQDEGEIVPDSVREAALQDYLDKMNLYVVNKRSAVDGKYDAGTTATAQAYTAAVIQRLDNKRLVIVVRFLASLSIMGQLELVGKLDLRDANLSWDNLRGADLRSANLSGANLWKANLSNADLGGADLCKANLCEADLSSANLSRADLCKANLSDADLREANLCEANLGDAKLLLANLSGAYLHEATLHRATLHDADLYRADMSRANMGKATLSFTNLRMSNLREANLREADLSSADLRYADLSGTDLREATLSGAKYNGKTKWTAYFNAGDNGAILEEE